MTPHPTYSPTSPCEALKCDLRQQDIRFCVRQFCPHRWQRQGAEDRARSAEREEREAKAREVGGGA
jgi:hypothetical protein